MMILKLTLVSEMIGSNDRTVDIIKEYARKNSNIKWYVGENKGPAYSFLELLFKENGYDYYSFCDQDDYWEEDKLIKAILMIKNEGKKPTLYFSALDIVDNELNFITKRRLSIDLSLDSLLMVNPVVGCTLVINDNLKKIIEKSKSVCSDIQMHDSWITRIAKVTDSQIIYDDNSYIKYRQHGKNVMGMNTTNGILKQINNFFRRKQRPIANISKELLNNYKEYMSNEYIKLLSNIVLFSQYHRFKNKVYLLKNIKSSNIKENIKFKYDVIFNKF